MEHRRKKGFFEGRWKVKGKCWPGVGRELDSNVERPANSRKFKSGRRHWDCWVSGDPPHLTSPATYSGLRGG